MKLVLACKIAALDPSLAPVIASGWGNPECFFVLSINETAAETFAGRPNSECRHL
jgi:hypothetical protein